MFRVQPQHFRGGLGPRRANGRRLWFWVVPLEGVRKQPCGPGTQGYLGDGIDGFEVLEAKGYPRFRDPAARPFWIFDGKTFWTYDDATTVADKMGYVNDEDLRGVMFWELSGDDPAGTLVSAIAGGLP